MNAEEARNILAQRYGIDSVVESHGVICLIDLNDTTIMDIRSILKEIGYNKTWGVRPKSSKDVEPIMVDEDTREKHVV